MFGRNFELDEKTLLIVEQIGSHMPGGFFVYRAEGREELLYANRAVLNIFGCENLDEFKELTGFTFRGMLHPDDYDAVEKAINAQVQTSEGSMDYVEYRIIRKDGQVRWVDDYGHYTETEAYGGIYYVFLSDITEKRTQRETDLAVRQAVIEALSKTYHTVWLINDVESGSFSLYRGDTKGETVHSLPIRDALSWELYPQAKDYYIRTTVAPEDQERLQEELELSQIRKRLMERQRFSVNYLRMMDDGSERYFRVEFAKMDMPDGKFGVVCGFKDVDEEVREGKAMQEALLRQEQQRVQQAQMITAMASDYRCVYYVTLDTDEGICYRTDHSFDNAVEVGEHFSFRETFTAYAESFVAEPYREGFLRFIEPDSIRAGLEKELMISYRYLCVREGKEKYEMLRMAGVRRPEDRDDHVVHAVGVGFTDIDREMRETLARSQALREALTVAEEANKAKTAFLSNMSHEIRTPMNAIIGLNNIAMNDPETSDKTREYLEKIGSSAKHLLSIINDILDMSRIESGRMIIKNEEFSFSKALEQVNTMISGQCRDKGLHYECRVKGLLDDYYIGDDMKLRQVMINILGNAVKFTEPGGTVRFSIEETARIGQNATLRFTISDNGIGMSREYLPHLFETFSQEDSSSTSKYGSTGLGMPITKSIVEMMNGRIEVESEKGVGTTFTVTVSLKTSERKKNGQNGEQLQPHEMTVLVVDDDPIACEHARIVLGQVGIDCDIAGSGAEAVKMVKMRHARRDGYNLILVDWKMPGMNGIETSRQIREVIGSETAIIILTSYNWDDVMDEAREAGVDSFVPKPLFAGSVMEEFREVFNKKNENLMKRRAELKGRHILLAEDVPVNAEIMMMILGAREIKADLAENGEKAVALFTKSGESYYDAILMDMRMPVMDGLEATRRIRAMDRPDAKRIPIIALTANAFDEDVQRSMQAGLNAHLSKPVEPESLYETLESLIV